MILEEILVNVYRNWTKKTGKYRTTVWPLLGVQRWMLLDDWLTRPHQNRAVIGSYFLIEFLFKPELIVESYSEDHLKTLFGFLVEE